MAPKLGFMPHTPQKAAGRTTDPAVWVPSASGTPPAATVAAEPEEEPPGVRAGAWGLRVGPEAPQASSVVTVLPRISAPAARSRRTTVASAPGRRPASSRVPFSVGWSAVSMMSLTPTGTPASAPRGPAASIARARSSPPRPRRGGARPGPPLRSRRCGRAPRRRRPPRSRGRCGPVPRSHARPGIAAAPGRPFPSRRRWSSSPYTPRPGRPHPSPRCPGAVAWQALRAGL